MQENDTRKRQEAKIGNPKIRILRLVEIINTDVNGDSNVSELTALFCMCVSLLYNAPNPQADSDNIDSMSLYLFLCWGLIQQKSRQRQKGETIQGWSKR